MQPISVLFYGRAGSGKGTQVQLLRDHLEKQSAAKPLIVETGAAFRSFIANDSYTSRRVKGQMDEGKLPEVFIPIWLWTNVLVEKYSGTEHFLFDGFPRRKIEAEVLDTAFKFYERQNVFVFVLNVSPEKTLERLKLRQRSDDMDAQIRERNAWYEADVIPTIEFYRAHGAPYSVIDVDGDRTVEEIHQDILAKLGLK